MNTTSTTVAVLPAEPERGQVFKIDTRDVSYLTHNFFKYPCKFIPQIPGWALDNLESFNGAKTLIFDPFAGSGTTLVEAVLRGYKATGSEIDPLGRLITKVKSSKYTLREVSEIKKQADEVLMLARTQGAGVFLPEIPNIGHWFTQSSQTGLGSIAAAIRSLSPGKAKDFLNVVFASTVRKASNADEGSPKPYVSSRFARRPVEPIPYFEKKLAEYLTKLVEYATRPLGKFLPLGGDARVSDLSSMTVDMAITSPPYINAFDYVRTLRLENLWLGLVDEVELAEMRRQNVGSESISVKSEFSEVAKLDKVANVLEQIKAIDLKRALIVDRFFEAMQANLRSVFRILKPGGFYVVVVANSVIRGVEVNTREILTELAEMEGFIDFNYFGYTIENRYLRIPRTGRGGFMDVDWVIILRKQGATSD